MGTVVIKKGDKKYPYWLEQSGEGPDNLYCRGNLDLLTEAKVITVVGSRQMSGYGAVMTDLIGERLVKNGWVVVSGMALGVDARIHKKILDCAGKVIAVLASGVDRPTPAANSWLYHRLLAQGGVVVSEARDGYTPVSSDFLKRNRIMAGLGCGVVVVEAGMKSGSLATARMAAELGREVWAVPGDVTRNQSQGCNWLISQGAGVVVG